MSITRIVCKQQISYFILIFMKLLWTINVAMGQITINVVWHLKGIAVIIIVIRQLKGDRKILSQNRSLRCSVNELTKCHKIIVLPKIVTRLSYARLWIWPLGYCLKSITLFSRNFSVDGEAANLLAASRCNGIWEMTRHNRHNGLLSAPFPDLLRTCRICCGLVADLLRGNWILALHERSLECHP